MQFAHYYTIKYLILYNNTCTMSITDNFELTLNDIKKWNTKYNNSKKIGVIRSNQQNIMNIVTISFGKRQFNILCSSSPLFTIIVS